MATTKTQYINPLTTFNNWIAASPLRFLCLYMVAGYILTFWGTCRAWHGPKSIPDIALWSLVVTAAAFAGLILVVAPILLALDGTNGREPMRRRIQRMPTDLIRFIGLFVTMELTISNTNTDAQQLPSLAFTTTHLLKTAGTTALANCAVALGLLILTVAVGAFWQWLTVPKQWN